jgi:hypothetical protein
MQRAAGLGVPAGPDAARITQCAVLVVRQQHPAHLSRRIAPVVEADHHELLAERAFELQPAFGARGDVSGVFALGHHAFQSHPAGGVQHLGRPGGEVFTEVDPRQRLAFELLAQQGAA